MSKLTPKQEQKLLRLGKVLDGGAVAVLSELEVAESKLEALEAKLEDVAGQLPALREAEDGKDGEQGLQGIQGEPGAMGEKGDTGPAGVDGKDGRDGANGRDGVDGKDGKDGVDGKDGKDGFIDEATVGYLEDQIKKIEKKTGGYGKVIRELRAGTNVTIDNSNMEYPVINATGGEQVLKDTFGITVDGAGTELTTGTKGFRYIEQDCTVTGWNVTSDVSGSLVFDVKRSGTSIAGTEKPTLSGASTASDLALSTWTVSLTAGDIIEFVIDSATTITRATLTILITKI